MKFINLKAYALVALTVFSLSACSQDESPINIGQNDLGLMSEEGSVEPGYKFKQRDWKIVLGMEVENTTREAITLDAVWQYREQGSFHEILRTEQNVKPGEHTVSYVFQSEQDLYRGEYTVEVFNGEDLVTAHRFWVVSDEQAENPSVGLYELSTCSPLKEEACFASEQCEKYEFTLPDFPDQPISICEAK